MRRTTPGRDPLVRLQLAFAMVAALGVAIWIVHGSSGGRQQIVFRSAICFIGGAGLIATTVLRLARSNRKQ